MKKLASLSLLGLFALSLAVPGAIAADDNKVVSGAKAVGKGIMWGPKKLWEGTKKMGNAMGNGAKKMMGK